MSSDSAAKGPRRSVRIGKYEVLSHIATGGMGAVYKARDTESGCEVALKVLSPEMAAKPAMIERFRREAKHAAKLQHQNVVTLHEFGEANHTCYLVMEFIDGIDLADYSQRKGPLDPQEALEIVVQACRALDHFHQRGVVHRDIKPSNFLLTRQGEQLLVKLTDLGLAREASDDEFRVTRAGTTVGTLDYMAPEQARDSGLADVRSDLYSLGGTWYHLLTGHPPFPKGGLGERLHRILHEEPENVRLHNTRVSRAMASVVHRLLAKRRSERYQTPADLLHDLELLQRGEPLQTSRQALESLAEEEAEAVPTPRKKSRPPSESRRPPRAAPSRSRSDTKAAKSTAEVPIPEAEENSRPYLWYSIGGAAAIILVVATVVALSLRRGDREDPPVVQAASSTEPVSRPVVAPSLPSKPQRNPKTDKHPNESTGIPAPPPKPTWPLLYRPSQPINVAALLKEIEAPWATPTQAGPTVELTVGRLPLAPSGKTFRSLASACKAVPAGATGIIELRDNGPFFDIPAAVADRSLVIRAAKGYHPLLVWDVQRTLDERRRDPDRRDVGPPSNELVFLDVRRGSLTLQDVQVAFKWPEAASAGAAVLRVEDGDLSVSGCTFSVAGKPRDGVTLVRFTATRPEAGRCRFERCYARGAKMSVLDLNAPGAQVLFENCLLVGEDGPLVQVRAAEDRPTRLRVVRSTMICGESFLELRPARAADHDPAFDWLGWDALLSRKKREVGGDLLRLRDDISSRHLSWRAINCLYAGWSTLLAGSASIPSTDISAWKRLWGRSEGEVVQPERWPSAVFPEPAEVPARTYRTAGSLVAFAASANTEQPLGCDLDRLPPPRDSWLALTFDRFVILAPAVPEDSEAPAISAADDGLFHGAEVDLNQTDLGDYVQQVQKTYRLAPEIVLRLRGNGERLTTPLRIKGSSVVLYFEPPMKKKKPLILVPAGRGSADALFDVEQGNLNILNGNVRFSDATEARVVPWLIKVRGGDVRLMRTHLEVPPLDSGAAFRGLIALSGSGDTAAERVRSCIVNESVLVSAHDALLVEGIGARVVLKQSLLIAGDDVIHLALDPDFTQKANQPGGTAKANVQCLFDHVTVSGRGAVLHLPDVQQPGPPAEPVIVQSRDCGFVNLFSRRHRSSLVRYDGEALAHGLLIWQSENDGFDHRLWFGAVCTTMPVPEKSEDHASWIALWGLPGMRGAKLDLFLARVLDKDRWSLEQRLTGWRVPGANLEQLDLSRNTAKKVPR
ncbi:MAG TPA: serine/threonine-protein kinase [Gemmataceae bacterium]|nr:serine/threonine-protein kinase [Gemmataceae bacterium]